MTCRVLVTGGKGFVGGFVVSRLEELGAEVTISTRAAGMGSAQTVCLGPWESLSEMTKKLKGMDVVVHLAAIVHDLNGRTSAAEVFAVNHDWTVRLAQASRDAGARHFVFGSTIKVNGEHTRHTDCFDETSVPRPQGAYAESKWKAERGLARGPTDQLGVTVIRPPLVYGPGVRANFLRLLYAIDRRIPLPFGAVDNARSLLFAGNYADFIAQLATKPAVPGLRTFVLSDGEDLSTPDLIRKLGRQLGSVPRLLPIPQRWLETAARALHKEPVARRLLDSLRIDSQRARRELNWTPPFTVDGGLEQTASWFLRSRAAR